MGRRLQGLGVLLIVATVALWVADAMDWIPSTTDDRWWGLTLKGAGIALAAGTLLRALSPITGRMSSSGRCIVCGRTTERGHAYCLDHLRETVDSTRDATHEREVRRTRPAGPIGR